MLQLCSAPGCTTRTIGPLCLDHEPRAEPRVFPRGRPYRLKNREVPAGAQLLRGKTTALDVVFAEGAS